MFILMFSIFNQGKCSLPDGSKQQESFAVYQNVYEGELAHKQGTIYEFYSAYGKKFATIIVNTKPDKMGVTELLASDITPDQQNFIEKWKSYVVSIKHPQLTTLIYWEWKGDPIKVQEIEQQIKPYSEIMPNLLSELYDSLQILSRYLKVS